MAAPLPSLGLGKGNNMALVYSYVRFSSRKQLQGDSLRRQVELGEEWIKRHNHTLAPDTLHDLGVSAFRGKNKDTGALKTFLDLIEAGKVKPGSILLVENLDRLSRQGVMGAFTLFTQIVQAGVDIVCLKPHEQVYTQATVNSDLTSSLLPLLYFHLAYVESKNKSQRVGDAWKTKRAEAQKKKKPFNRRRPAWLDWNEDTGFVINAEAKEAIKFIFEKTAEGWGQRLILGELQKKFRPIGRSGRWNSSYIQKVLNDRAVLGELQPRRFNEEGNRVPEGPPIPGYYPKVIEEELWHQAQADKKQRRKLRGRNGDFVHLFKGLLVNAHDGSKMHMQTTRAPRDGSIYVQRRLVSEAHSNKLVGADSVSVPYLVFEGVVLKYLTEISLEDIEPVDSGRAITAKRHELLGIDARLSEIQESLSDPASFGLPTLLKVVQELEARRSGIAGQIEVLEQEQQVKQPLDETQSILNLLAAATDERLRTLRLRLRSQIGHLLESIMVKPEKHYGRVYVTAQLNFKSGMCKKVSFGPDFQHGQKQQGSCECQINLNDRESVKARSIWATYAKNHAQPPDGALPTTIPPTLGPAAALWLEHAKRKMARHSFRVVPSKIRRFVEFIGKEVPTASLDQRLWRKWAKFLRKKMAEGELARGTARVTFSRAREFVRWLQENNVAPAIPELKASSAKILA